MKKYMVLLLVLLLASPVWAQNRTLIRRRNQLNAPEKNSTVPTNPVPGDFDQGKWVDEGELVDREFQHDLFVAPVLKFSQVNEEFGLFAGGRAGWILNHHYVFSLGGYGVVNNVEAPGLSSGVKPDLMMSYGGVEFEYVLYPADMIHFSLYTLLGLGLAEYDYTLSDGDDTFWVIEPGVNLLVNVTRFFRTGLGVGYRVVTGVDLERLEDSDLSGFAATLTLKFGSF